MREKARETTGRSHSTIRHELKSTEKRMATLHARREALDTELADSGADHERLRDIGEAIVSCDAEIVEVEEAWLELSEELENR